MAPVAVVCELPRRPRHVPQCERSQGWPRRSAALRSQAEEMLREMAFVYKATRSIRESMME
jgi:hypothetical protein